ncbi:MMPL family transporter [Lentilactobacillus hilgardii]|nr:MMPL family transporter [Lentilactobacillus hilgardii]
MNKFFKKYIGVIIAWVVVAIAAIFMMPNSFNLVASHGQTSLPKSAQSQVANTLKNNWGPKLSHTRQVLVVFSNGKAKLNDIQRNQINTTLTTLENKKDQFDIKNIVKPSVDSAAAVSQPSNAQSTAAAPSSSQSSAASSGSDAMLNNDPSVSAELNSKDGTTMIAQLNVGKRDLTVRQMDTKLKAAVRTASVKTYITSPDSLINDTQHATEAGLGKTEIIAIVIILLVLILLFRSLLIPLVSLISTGIAYIISLAIVLNLVSRYHFPFSNFTQISMLILLLGLGTDFSILLINEFKKQLRAGKDQLEATLAARRNAGKTILISSLTLIVLFSLLGFANYSLYESLVGVAIGILVLLLVLMSFTPFFLFFMGETIFWPSSNLEAHNYSRSWGFLSTKSAAHPLIALIIALIVATPFVFLNQKHLNHNDAAEITLKYPSKKGYQIVNQHYANGMNAPVSIYIKSDHSLRDQTDLQQIETITRPLRDQKGIHSVNSATEPHGQPLKQLYVNQQLNTLTGDNDAVSSGMSDTSKKLKSTSIQTDGLDSVTGDAQSITSMVSTIQNEFNNSGVFATPAQMVDELQQKLRSEHRRRLTSMQRTVVTEALSRALNDQQQQTQMNSALSGIGLKTDSINSSTNSFKSELQNVQNQVRGYASTLDNLNNSLTNSNNFLKALAKSSVGNTIYIPDNVINADYFKTLIGEYLSTNEKTTRLDVVLNATPGSKKSIELVQDLENQVNYDLRGTQLKGATVAVGGYNSMVVDNQQAARTSFKRVAILLSIAAALILMIVAGSILQPVYLVGSLGITYLMSLGFTKWFSAQFLGQKWLTANMPFLTFMMLLAFGVDYSIYLLMKYKQTDGKGKSAERMINASILIGTVVIFAIVVISVIFASLMSSGVLTLIQVAIAVIFGLIIFGIVVPSIMPGLMRLTYEGFNFKQLRFRHRRTDSKSEK